MVLLMPILAGPFKLQYALFSLNFFIKMKQNINVQNIGFFLTIWIEKFKIKTACFHYYCHNVIQ